jgi:hypothetical protein
MRNFLPATCLLLTATPTSGCNRGDGPSTGNPASGKVTLDGIPVEGASVSFCSLSPVAGPVSGMTDAEGIYRITSVEKDDGAPVGDHFVAIIKITGESCLRSRLELIPPCLLAIFLPLTTRAAKRNRKPSYLVPRKYGVASTFGLKVTVPSGGGIGNFELSAR